MNRGGGDELWAITSFFNPVGYRRRLENYRRFRARLGIPLVAVELAFRDAYELAEGDADILIQLRGGDRMWQKERLLNIALAAVPATCRKIAWLDCDVIFDSDDWAERASRLLDRAGVVQAFRYVHYMPQELRSGEPDPGRAILSRAALAFAIESGLLPAEGLRQLQQGEVPRFARGLAWAARRELIEVLGFFDECIIGGGDSAMACAAYGCLGYPLRRQSMHEPQAARYLAWGARFRDAVAGEVAALEGNIFHLWHGSIENRKHGGRYRGLERFGFDPSTDLVATGNGPWRWNSEKRDMHDYVGSYFASRAEDG